MNGDDNMIAEVMCEVSKRDRIKSMYIRGTARVFCEKI